MAHTMSDDERRAFLAVVRTAKLATTRADGRPHVAPIWFAPDEDGSVVFTTGEDTVKGRNILRDPRVALCVDDDRSPFAFVVMEGRVEVSRDPAALLRWATVLGGRYMGQDQAEVYGRRNAVPGELLVRLAPEHVVASAALAE